ncbi:MAG TPA: hypothetical protein V6C58_14230 [Allocoleopsis sp.]
MSKNKISTKPFEYFSFSPYETLVHTNTFSKGSMANYIPAPPSESLELSRAPKLIKHKTPYKLNNVDANNIGLLQDYVDARNIQKCDSIETRYCDLPNFINPMRFQYHNMSNLQEGVPVEPENFRALDTRKTAKQKYMK